MEKAEDEWICGDCREAFNVGEGPSAVHTYWDGEMVRAKCVCYRCLYKPDISDAVEQIDAAVEAVLSRILGKP